MIKSIFDDPYHWPDKWSSPDMVKLERSLRRTMKPHGYGLVSDRTRFTDKHFRGGYMICDHDRIISGTDFELTLFDCVEWMRSNCPEQRKPNRKRA